jgi:hypothetical protein
MMKSLFTAAVLTMAVAIIGPTAQAAPVLGEYSVSYCCGSPNGPQIGAAANGLTYIGTVNPADLTGIDIVVAGAYSSQFTSWIANGGAFIYHDWSPSHASLLPGMANVTGSNFSGSNIDVISAISPITAGPFGTLTNTNMDGGNSSNHGYVDLASLTSTDPLVSDITAILSNGNNSKVTEFSYRYGLGLVIYAAMPTDAYSGSSPFATPGTAGLSMLAKNEIAYAASVASNGVPEPGSLALFGIAALGFASFRRRQASTRN